MASTMEARIRELINQLRSLQADFETTYGVEAYGHRDMTSPPWYMERGVDDLEWAIVYTQSVDRIQRIVAGEGYSRTDLLEAAVYVGIITQAQSDDGSATFSDTFLREKILKYANESTPAITFNPRLMREARRSHRVIPD